MNPIVTRPPPHVASGYSEDAVIHDGRLDEGVTLLNKPYDREALGRAVRSVLDAQETGRQDNLQRA